MSEQATQNKVAVLMRDKDPAKFETLQLMRRQRRESERKMLKGLKHRPGHKNIKCKKCNTVLRGSTPVECKA